MLHGRRAWNGRPCDRQPAAGCAGGGDGSSHLHDGLGDEGLVVGARPERAGMGIRHRVACGPVLRCRRWVEWERWLKDQPGPSTVSGLGSCSCPPTAAAVLLMGRVQRVLPCCSCCPHCLPLAVLLLKHRRAAASLSAGGGRGPPPHLRHPIRALRSLAAHRNRRVRIPGGNGRRVREGRGGSGEATRGCDAASEGAGEPASDGEPASQGGRPHAGRPAGQRASTSQSGPAQKAAR